jgi:hypothetical protein
LADILALIQVLAQHKYAHRSEEALQDELQGKPQSGCSWTCVAQEHPEFFRVYAEGKHGISLLVRHATLPDADHRRQPLSDEFTHGLLSTAVELHDRQLQRSQRWVPLIPMWTAVLTGLISLSVALIAAAAAIYAAYIKH